MQPDQSSRAVHFGAGVYRVFTYGGALTDNGLVLGSTPPSVLPGDLTVQTSVAGVVNLVSTAGMTLGFWDGAAASNDSNGTIDGGDGTWTVSGRNWTDATGALTGRLNPQPSFVVFGGAAGTVMIDDAEGAISATGIQFAADGYTLAGDTLSLVETPSIVRVGDGSAASAGWMATIAAQIAGSGGLTKQDAGTLVLTGANSYTGGTTIAAGTLQIGDGGTAGSIPGDVANAGTLVFNRSDDLTFAGAIGGSGALVQAGAGTLTLSGTTTYSGGTSIMAGTLRLTEGANLTGPIANDATLVFARSGPVTHDGVISGNGTLVQAGSGPLMLEGDSSGFTGTTRVASGALLVGGSLGSALEVASGATLGGGGQVAGAVSIADGGQLAGVQGQTLRLGSLTLGSGAQVDVALDAPGGAAAALFDVTGDLVLDGTLNIIDAGQFGAGVYRLFDYGGVLTDNGLAIGALPQDISSDDLFVQTSVANRINLISTAGVELSFWDGGAAGQFDNGVVDGGTGTWTAGGRN